jgi:hypothetical protein
MDLMFHGLPDIAALLAAIYALISAYWVHFVVDQRGHNLEPLGT